MSDTEIMLNFTNSPVQLAPQQETRQSTPKLRETVKVTANEGRATYLLREPADWTWQDLQAYVARKIIEIHGPFPRDDRKEYGIFRSFLSRHGNMAGPIAVFAFEQAGGTWKGAPISVTRFCKGSDPYFAEPITKRLQG